MKPSDRIAVISPHLDDGIFSLGDFMQGKDITIITPFSATPNDDVGRKKYEILHREHRKACEILGVKNIINGPFLDDVYPNLDHNALWEWLWAMTRDYDVVLVPLGIRHPDHIATREAMDRIVGIKKMYYSDLPYATDYPFYHDDIVKELTPYSLKERAVRAYTSQTKDDVTERCMQREQLWTEE